MSNNSILALIKYFWITTFVIIKSKGSKISFGLILQHELKNVLHTYTGNFCDYLIFALFTISIKLEITEYAEIIFCFIF